MPSAQSSPRRARPGRKSQHRPPLVADSCPTLKLVIVQRESLTHAGEDQHSSADQLIADVSGRAGIPISGSDASGLGQDVVTAIGDLAQLFESDTCG
jgi:hypothetical protein